MEVSVVCSVESAGRRVSSQVLSSALEGFRERSAFGIASLAVKIEVKATGIASQQTQTNLVKITSAGCFTDFLLSLQGFVLSLLNLHYYFLVFLPLFLIICLRGLYLFFLRFLTYIISY